MPDLETMTASIRRWFKASVCGSPAGVGQHIVDELSHQLRIARNRCRAGEYVGIVDIVGIADGYRAVRVHSSHSVPIQVAALLAPWFRPPH